MTEAKVPYVKRQFYINNVLRYFLTEKCHATVGHTISPFDAIKLLVQYVRSNNLGDPENKALILYEKDQEFSQLINLPNNSRTLTYFNLLSSIKDLLSDSITKMPMACQKEIADRYVEKQHRPGGEMYIVAMEDFKSLSV